MTKHRKCSYGCKEDDPSWCEGVVRDNNGEHVSDCHCGCHD